MEKKGDGGNLKNPPKEHDDIASGEAENVPTINSLRFKTGEDQPEQKGNSEGSKMTTSAAEITNTQDTNTNTNNALTKLWDDLNLNPNQNLTLKRARTIDNHTLGDDQLTSLDQLPNYIFNKLMIVDYHVREFITGEANPHQIRVESKSNDGSDDSSDEDDVLDISSMDALLAVFYCSDNFLRRYFAVKLSECQLSVPFLLPDPAAPSQNITMLLSALQNITKCWNSGSGPINAFVTEHPFPVVSFIRIGRPEMSKSSLINKIMSDGSTAHQYFFNSEVRGGGITRKIVHGLVELIWYLPGQDQEQTQYLQHEICFANLRGDAGMFKTQRDVLLKISSVVCIILPMIMKSPDETVKEIVTEIAQRKIKTILIFPQKIQDNEQKKDFKDLKETHDNKISLIVNKNKPKFLQRIQKNIQKNIQDVKPKSLADHAQDAREYGISFDDDQQVTQFGETVDNWLKDGIKKAKSRMKLQTHISKLAKLERKMHCPKSDGNTITTEEKEKIYQKIHKNEKAQKNSFESLDTNIRDSFNYFAMMNEFERNKALDRLKRQLNKMSLKHQAQNDQPENFSFGVEHIIRELAQLYQLSDFHTNDYAGAAADMLLSGQPLEILDGDSFYIPLRWFKAVFAKLEEKTKNAKIFVISVVGIQSSGKSTMLNTMFGLEFPVSAGRCTRGAFATLLPVSHSLKSASEFDFVLIVDTEGLRGSGDPLTREHDNELATFVIGLADVTIVNIMGENPSEMKEFLEIAVFAFLKMKLVQMKKISCRIVHHNVIALDANVKLKDKRSTLIESLDKMTKLAAIQEKCDDKYNKFNDIISFNENEDVFYLPSLLEGNPPMAPVNPKYGKYCQTIKRGITTLMCSKEIPRFSVSYFRNRVVMLWEAILKENFIFSFQNASEIRARTSLDEKYFTISTTVMDTGMAELKINIGITLENCSTRDEREKKWDEIESEIRKKAREFGDKMKEKMDAFFEKDEDNAILAKWREEIWKKIATEEKNQETKVMNECFKTYSYFQKLQDIEEERTSYEEKITAKAKVFSSTYKDEAPEKLEDLFEKAWLEWMKDVPLLQEKEIDIKEEMVSFLTKKYSVLLKTENIGNISIPVKGSVVIGINDLIYNMNLLTNLFNKRKTQRLCVLCAKQINKIVITKSLNYAKNASESGNGFTQHHLEELYYIVFTTIDEEATDCFNFKNSAKYNILQNAFAQSYNFFLKMHERFVKERDIRGNLEKQLKPSLARYCIGKIHPNKEQELVAISLFEVLKKQIDSALESAMGLIVTREVLKNNDFQSKGRFHAKVLIELMEKGEFASYIPYLDNPVEFLREKFMESIKDYCLSEILPFINSCFQEEVKKIREEVKSAILLANKGRESGDKKLTSWIDQFVENFTLLVVKKEMFVVAAIEDRNDVDVFIQTVDEKVKNHFETLTTRDVDLATIHIWCGSLNSLFEKMFSCQSICPFCNALCDESMPNHTTHSTKSHRPMGIFGIKNVTEKLSTNICTECVTGDKTFLNLDTLLEKHPYKEYRSVNDYYKSWEITGEKSLKSSLYWKWFMATFSKELAQKHDAKSDSPFSWKFISFKKAKEQLMDEYDL
ncbi:interferon-induced very large GTPase 1-like [Dendronephthya gigantea]|uniref:interferon-induced very large GTPase 1-like n=1 Tax=Dendronephthya gigantea TaxID=151771 RepID=UPI001068D6E9|nr:interferon-induced very large GTPase 1-like [Dendronephthya gigantea]